LLIRNAEIRNKASELLLREVKEEEAKAKNCTKKRIRSASDDEENPGEVIAGDVTDDSDSQKSGSGTQSLAGGGIASDDESSSEGGHGLHFDDLVESKASTWIVTFADISLSSERSGRSRS
jgi:hypothetical protein